MPCHTASGFSGKTRKTRSLVELIRRLIVTISHGRICSSIQAYMREQER